MFIITVKPYVQNNHLGPNKTKYLVRVVMNLLQQL
jgi:hypothetical protein